MSFDRDTAEALGQPSSGPKVVSIWAEDRGGIIGDGQGMLWHVPADFRHFKAATMGCPVIMGRLSFEALGKPLPGRANLVLSRREGYAPAGVEVLPTLESALSKARLIADEGAGCNIWISGGGRVYAESMGVVDELVVTYLDLEVNPDDAKHEGRSLVAAPRIDPQVFEADPARSDTAWREKSGDARWKVITYVRRD